jgi:hypothetical protein
MVAFSARRLVCSAIAWIRVTTSPILLADSASRATRSLVRLRPLRGLFDDVVGLGDLARDLGDGGRQLLGRRSDGAHIGARGLRRGACRLRLARGIAGDVLQRTGRLQHRIGAGRDIVQLGLDVPAELDDPGLDVGLTRQVGLAARVIDGLEPLALVAGRLGLLDSAHGGSEGRLNARGQPDQRARFQHDDKRMQHHTDEIGSVGKDHHRHDEIEGQMMHGHNGGKGDQRPPVDPTGKNREGREEIHVPVDLEGVGRIAAAHRRDEQADEAGHGDRADDTHRHGGAFLDPRGRRRRAHQQGRRTHQHRRYVVTGPGHGHDDQNVRPDEYDEDLGEALPHFVQAGYLLFHRLNHFSSASYFTNRHLQTGLRNAR